MTRATPMKRAMLMDGAMLLKNCSELESQRTRCGRRAGAREEVDEDPGEDAFAQPEQRQSAPMLALPGRPHSRGATCSRPTSWAPGCVGCPRTDVVVRVKGDDDGDVAKTAWSAYLPQWPLPARRRTQGAI